MNKSFLKRCISFILPISAVAFIPGILLFIFYTQDPWGIHYFSVIQVISGSILFIPGIILFIMCIRLFHRIGKGTLAPWSPPEHMVIQGPYKYIRNPMIASVIIILIAETIISGSPVIGIWTLFFFIGNSIYFRYCEEPGLIKRFGDEYSDYKKTVPMWIPRIRRKHG